MSWSTQAPPCPICGRSGTWIGSGRSGNYAPPLGHVTRVMPMPVGAGGSSTGFGPPGVRYDLCPRLDGDRRA